MKVTRQQLQEIVKQEYAKLLKENIDDMQDMDADMNMYGTGYEAASMDDEEAEHVHDDTCGHMDSDVDTESDDESSMFRSHITSITKQIEELENLVQQGDNVEEWVQEKMAVAASMIDSIYHYLSHGDEETDDDMGGDDDYDDEADEYDDDMDMDDEVEDDETEFDDELDNDEEIEDDEMDMDDELDDELDQDEEDEELYEQSDYVNMDPAQYPTYGYKKDPKRSR